ncbi:MAG TPA: FmdB family transcriptional regulator [Opitutaceae bacterium]|nr:FmdB family transcriptional regulator [Opitutaceae bacterium]
MPIYEFYCPDNHRIYQFYARTLAQGRTVPKCPDNPRFGMRKIVSPFAVVGRGREKGAQGEGGAAPENAADPPVDARMEAAMGEMEREFSGVDENDPRAMGRMMRRMADLTGEKIDGEMEEVVRKLEEGADPDSLEDRLAGDPAEGGEGPPAAPEAGEAKPRFRARRGAPVRDPRLYDYP